MTRKNRAGVGTCRMDNLRRMVGKLATQRSTRGVSLALLVLAGVIIMIWSGPADAATIFTVNRAGDAGDTTLNGTCDTSRERGRQCTLRAAIQEANSTAGPDIINFNIGGTTPVRTIFPTTPLPEITDQVTIDGYSQQGSVAGTLNDNAVLNIQLNGIDAGPGANGLEIRATDSTIKGLVINRFQENGILIEEGATGNKVEGNFIGTDPSGKEDRGNGGNGVFIDGATNNVIGGPLGGARNVISGNGGDCTSSSAAGVRIEGSLATGNNKVEGNYIGTKKGGASSLGNCSAGVSITDSASGNTIGGTLDGARNIISGNDGDGVYLGGSATGNRVERNHIGIGTDSSGTAPDVGNGGNGVFITESASGNTVGGNRVGNIIVDNKKSGIFLGGGVTGTKVEGNFVRRNVSDGVTVSDGGNIIGGTSLTRATNTIFNNGGAGVKISGGNGNRILSNHIFANAGLGIDLSPDGVTGNDADDPDTGANNLQNFPVITLATTTATATTPGVVTIAGTLNSNPDQEFTVQCFIADGPSGEHGEGQIFIAETNTTPTSEGEYGFSCSAPTTTVLPEDEVTATATNTATGDTSEFSSNETVGP